MNHHKAAELLEAHPFRDAKTAIRNPHSYTMKNQWKHPEQFEAIVGFIREKGELMYFWKKPYIILTMNGYRYWSMGDPVKETILLNRAVHRYGSAYDLIAPDYDEIIKADPDYMEAWELTKPFIDFPAGARVLEVGSGTGTLFDLMGTTPDPENYVGVETSWLCADEFSKKYPDHPVVRCPIEEFWRGKFDRIYCLMGTGAYCQKGVDVALRYMLNPGGVGYMVFYDNDHITSAHQIIEALRPGTIKDFYISRFGDGAGAEIGKYRMIKLKPITED